MNSTSIHSDFFENGFISSQYTSMELPDDFFFDSMSERARGDETLYELHSRYDVNGVVTGKLFEYSITDGYASIGPKDTCPPIYNIQPDYIPAEQVFDYYRDYIDKPGQVFPDLPVAQPIVSDNKLYKREKRYPLAAQFVIAGYSLYKPSYSMYLELATQSKAYTDKIKFSGEELYNPDVEDDLYEPFDDTLKKTFHGNYVSMQFNPFHPFAIKKIIKHEWITPYIIKGFYEDLDKAYPFEFDLHDTRFRMHSDQWMPNVPTCPSYLAVFDLVSNHDFKNRLFFKVHNLVLEPLIIEPIISTRDPPPGYSVIGPWEGSLERGRNSDSYSPAATNKLNIEIGDQKRYADITPMVRFKDNVLSVCHTVDYDPDQVELFPLKPGSVDLPEKYFIRWFRDKTDQPRTFRFFIDVSIVRDPKVLIHPTHNFHFVKDFFFSGCPKNKYGSLIYQLSCLQLSQALELAKYNQNIHEFVSRGFPVINHFEYTTIRPPDQDNPPWDIGECNHQLFF